jgi:hypothetical protein
MRRAGTIMVVVALTASLAAACSGSDGDAESDDSVPPEQEVGVGEVALTTVPFEVAPEDEQVCAALVPYDKVLTDPEAGPATGTEVEAVQAAVALVPADVRPAVQLVADGLAAASPDDTPYRPEGSASLELLRSDELFEAQIATVAFLADRCGVAVPGAEEEPELAELPDTADVEDGEVDPDPPGGIDPDDLRAALEADVPQEAEAVARIWVAAAPGAVVRVRVEVAQTGMAGKQTGLALCEVLSARVYDQLGQDEVVLDLDDVSGDWDVTREGADQPCR